MEYQVIAQEIMMVKTTVNANNRQEAIEKYALSTAKLVDKANVEVFYIDTEIKEAKPKNKSINASYDYELN